MQGFWTANLRALSFTSMTALILYQMLWKPLSVILWRQMFRFLLSGETVKNHIQVPCADASFVLSPVRLSVRLQQQGLFSAALKAFSIYWIVCSYCRISFFYYSGYYLGVKEIFLWYLLDHILRIPATMLCLIVYHHYRCYLASKGSVIETENWIKCYTSFFRYSNVCLYACIQCPCNKVQV